MYKRKREEHASAGKVKNRGRQEEREVEEREDEQ